MASRAEMFENEKKRRDEENSNRGGFTPPDYENVDYTALENNVVKVFRFVGNPVGVRDENWHPKKVLTSRIIDDKGKLFTCRWSEDKNWLLWKIFNEVMKYKWDKDAINTSTGKPGVRVYTNAIKYPEIFNRIRYNGKENPNAMERGWNPSASIMMNCICRDEYDWHKENKSFKLIAKKANEVEDSEGKKTTYYEPGIGVTTYDLLVKAVLEEHGDWQDFDIAIRKEDDDPWYSVYSFFDSRKIEKDLHCEMNGDPLTEEELTWKKFDIDKLTQVTSYRKIKNRLGDFIKNVDVAFKTHYFEELSKLADAEQAEWDAKEAQKEQDQIDEAPKQEPVKKEEAKPEVRTETRSRSRAPAGNLDIWDKMRNAGWKGVDDLKAEYGTSIKDVVIGATFKESSLVVEIDGEVVPKEQQLDCCDCGMFTPDFFKKCPACGCEFK